MKQCFTHASVLAFCFFLQQTALSAQFQGWYASNRDPAAIAELQRLGVSVTEEFLVSVDGTRYPRLSWQSEWHKQLSLSLEDPLKATGIASAFRQHLMPKLPDRPLRQRVRTWISEHAIYFGSAKHPAITILKEHPLWQTLLVHSALEESDWQHFFAAVSESSLDQYGYEQFRNKPNSQTLEPITFLTTSGGGGHFTVAQAMAHRLHTLTPHPTQWINYAELQKHCDPLWIASKKYTGDIIYNEIFQQENDQEKTALYWSLYGVLENYIPNTCTRQVKEQIKAHGSHLLLSSTPHMRQHIDVAYSLDIPLRMVSTDYQILGSLFSSIFLTATSLVKYWIPGDDIELLIGLSQVSSECPTGNFRQRLFRSACQHPAGFASIAHEAENPLQVLGYPVRQQFRPSENKAEENGLRQTLNIPEGQRVLVLSMGRQGVGIIKKMVEQIHTYAHDLTSPVHLVVVCGKNTQMQAEILDFLKNNPSESSSASSKVSFRILGFLGPDELAQYYQVAEGLISKAGGASTAELAAMGLPMLVCHSHSWEACNKDFLYRHGLAFELDEHQPLVPQLNAFLAQNLKDSVTFRPVDWQERFVALFSEATDYKPNP